MRSDKRIFPRVLWVAGIFLTLVSITAFFLPGIINNDLLKSRIQDAISQAVGGTVAYERVDLGYFPLPHFAVHKGTYLLAGDLSGKFASLEVYPGIFSLLTGDFTINKLVCDTPETTLKLSKVTSPSADTASPASFETVKDIFLIRLKFLVSLIDSDREYLIKNGTFTVYRGKQTVLRLRDINTTLDATKKQLRWGVRCRSDLFENLSFNETIDAEPLFARGKVELNGLHPESITEALLPDADLRLGESRVDLNISYETDGRETFKAGVEGAVPQLTLIRGKEKMVVKSSLVKGTVRTDDKSVSVSLGSLQLETPELNLSGEFVMDRRRPKMNLKIEGRELDLGSIRKAAFFAAGDADAVKNVFDRLKGGRVTSLAIRSEGKTTADLADLDNIHIEGLIVDGQMWVPEAKLDLTGVKGEVSVSSGILEGKNLAARLKDTPEGKDEISRSTDTYGQNGMFRLDLNDKKHPFSLDMEVEAELAQLPAVLTHLLKSDPIQKEIAQISNISGKALGRLTLNKKQSHIETKVAVSRFNLQADYRRLPYPVKLSGGRIIFSGTRIELKNIHLILKSNEISGFSVNLDWSKALDLQVEAGASRIDMGEVNPWILSFKTLSPKIKTIFPTSGIVTIEKGRFRGNLRRPKNWEYDVAGETKSIRTRLPGLPGPVDLVAGKFKKIGDKLTIKKMKIRMLDASLTLSGEVKGDPNGGAAGNTGFDGILGPEAIRWASRVGRFPPWINLRPPVSITGAKLAWDKKKNITFSGNISMKNGPVVGVDLLKTPTAVRIKRLSIKDDRSRVLATADFEPKRLRLTFKGNLNGRTLDAVLTENRWMTGSISGDFQTLIPIENPIQSTVRGSLEAEGLSIPFNRMPPVKMNRLSLTGEKNLIRVNSASLTWEDKTFGAKGNVTLLPEGVQVDADLSTDGLDWKYIQEILEKVKRNKESPKKSPKKSDETDKKTGPLPLRGTLRCKADYFKYERFTWRPLHATISFEPGSIDIALENANLCGISTPGTIRVSSQGVKLDVQPVGRELSLKDTLLCLEEKKYEAEGALDLKGSLSAGSQAGGSDAIRSIEGDLTVVVREGSIHQSVAFSRVLELINVADILKNDLPDPSKEGFAFKEINTNWRITNGKLILEDGKLQSSAMGIACKGHLDLVSLYADFTALVAPLQNADYIINKIPILGYILGGHFIAIPFKVEGPLGDVTVTPVPGKTAVTGLEGILTRTLKAPFKIIQPIPPPKNDNEPEIHRRPAG